MGFETVMLSVVKDVVRHASAEFTYCTLFVGNIDKSEATLILNNLRHFANCEVRMNEVGTEYAYDFV